MRWFTLDYETKSRVDLIKNGLDNYVKDPDFDAIIVVLTDLTTNRQQVASAYGDTIVSVKNLLYPLLISPAVQFICHNAMFEYVVSCQLCERWGIPQPALSRFHCSSLAGSVVGLPASLDRIAEILFGEHKVASGKALINLFCKPDKKTGEFNTARTHPLEWAEFKGYAKVDDVLTGKLWKALPPVPAETRLYWLATGRMNLRGFAVDMETVNRVLEDVEMIKADAHAVTKSITKGLVNKATERKKLLDFVNSRGCEGQSLTSVAVMEWIEDPNTPEDVVELLWARLAASKSTFGKYAAFKRFVSSDGRSRHSFWPYGAHTGRLAGKGIQPQNITYDRDNDFPDCSSSKLLKLYWLGLWGEWDRTKALVAMTRSVIWNESGKKFYKVDYASIEARIVVWLANVRWSIRKYEKNEDQYIPMAAVIFGIPENQVTKAQRNKYGKVTVLGGGYGMGPDKFAKQNDKTIEEAKRCIYSYRNKYSEVTYYWNELQEAFKACVFLKKTTVAQAPAGDDGVKAPKVRFFPEYIEGVFYVKCVPPGNRPIWYRNPKVDGTEITFERTTAKKTWRQKIWGGTFLENISQNIAGVIIFRGMQKLERLGALPELQIHDEAVAAVDDDFEDRENLDCAMRDIEGFPGLPLDVESTFEYRFSK